jgi:AraC-like DNA-binding protein
LTTYFTLSIIGGLQGILLAFFIFIKGKKKPSILFLSFYLFIFSLGLFENWFLIASHDTFTRLLVSFISNSAYLYGPLLYLFVHYLANEIPSFSKKDIIHFIPFLVFLCISMLFLFLNKTISNRVGEIAELILFELLIIQVLTYNLIAIYKLRKHHEGILQNYSSLEERDLTWLKLFMILLTSIYVLSFFLSHLVLAGVKKADDFFIVVQVAITSSIYLMSYRVLSSPHLFTESQNGQTDNVEDDPAENKKQKQNESELEAPINERYKKSGLTIVLAQQHLEALKNYMDKEKPYKNPDLNVYILSQKLGISKNHLTEIINEHLKMNFFELINRYRVEEAKQLLANDEFAHLSLNGIASEAGYKSKATFFSNFKKITSHTPQEWKKRQRDSA